MSRDFEESLIFEGNEGKDPEYDDWLIERKVKVCADAWEMEEDLGDSCCFGTRTVEVGLNCIWKLHGGV